MEKENHSKTIEIMKALSIMGIVLLHAIFIEEGEDNELSTVLRLVSIKTLLFLSGFVVYGKIQKEGWVLEKIVRRIPLILIFTGLYWVFARYVVGIDGGTKLTGNIFGWYSYNLAIGFNGLVIWYIWVLMICYVLLWMFEKYVASRFMKIPYLVKLSILTFALIWIPYDYFGIAFVRWYGLFMILGYGIRYAVENYRRFYEFGKKAVYLSIPLLPLVTLLIGSDLIFKGQWASSTGYINIMKAVTVGEIKYILIFSLITLLGIAFSYCLAKLISLNKYVAKPFLYVGSATIGILLLHKPLLELNLIHNYWLSAILALVITFNLYQLLKRVRILDFLLFGGTDIPIKISHKLEDWYGKAKA